MSGRPVQYFTEESLARGKRMSPEQILRFLDDFRRLHAASSPRGSRLISVRVPEDLLAAFKTRSELVGVPYQAQIKTLMRGWLGV